MAQKKIKCSNAGYIFDGTDSTLPIISAKDGEEDISWEVRTRLGVNTAPSMPQELYNENYIKSNTNENAPSCEETIRLFKEKPSTDDYYNDQSKELIVKIASTDIEKVSIKTNYTVDETADLIQTSYNLIDSDNNEVTVIDDFKVKAFIDNKIKIKENAGNASEILNLNNMSTYFTSFTFDDGETGKQYSTIHCAIPNKNTQFGIIMIYYVSNSDTSNLENLVRLRVKKNTTDPTNLTIFNNWFNNNNAWWSGYTAEKSLEGENYDLYYLKPNVSNNTANKNILNVIKINNSSDIYIDAGADKSDVLIFSPLRIVNYTTEEVNGKKYYDEGINLDLINYYYADAEETAPRYKRAKQLLNDIKEIDGNNREFFYNTIVDSSTELDINIYATPEETLATPSIWYSYNNMNNKFTVSEIDTNYIDTGITFASSSMKNY